MISQFFACAPRLFASLTRSEEAEVKFLKKFFRDESGAVTVDWVVLTAAMVGIAISVVSLLEPGLNSAADDVSGAITTTVSSVLS